MDVYCAGVLQNYLFGVVFSNFCIIEGPETVQDFVQMQLQEIQDNIRSRRNKIFLLMEEVHSHLKFDFNLLNSGFSAPVYIIMKPPLVYWS